MTDEDRSKIREIVNELDGLKSRNPEEKKFKDWKEKAEKKLEEVFGKSSEPISRLRRIRFVDFNRPGKPEDSPLSERERREYINRLDEAKRLLQNFT